MDIVRLEEIRLMRDVREGKLATDSMVSGV